jgi:branched-chain amino acid transport system substrate-binding protein
MVWPAIPGKVNTMEEREPSEPRTITRRKFVQGVGVGIVGGLLVGGAAGAAGGLLIGGNEESSSPSTPGSGGGPAVKIGASLPLTGALAAVEGIEQKQASQLAIDEWNARGGVLGRKIEYIVQDAADMAPETMLSNFNSLIDKSNVDAIVEGYQLFTGPELDLVAASETIYVNTNTASNNVEIYSSDPAKYYTCFMVDPPEVWYGKGFPAFAQSLETSKVWQPKNKKIAIIMANVPYATAIGAEVQSGMTKLGWTVSLFEKFDTPLNEWGPILQKIRSDPPDWIFVSDPFVSDMASFNKQFYANPTKSLVYGQYSPGVAGYIDLTGAASNGIIWGTLLGIKPSEIGDDFRAAYEKKYGKAPSECAGGVLYDSINLYLNAVAIAGSTDSKAVAPVLAEQWYAGVCGVYHMNAGHYVPAYPDETTDPAAGVPHMFLQIQDGQQKVIYPQPYTQSEFQLPSWF